MFQSATLKNISPLRLSFASSLRVIRRAIPEFQRQIDTKADINKPLAKVTFARGGKRVHVKGERFFLIPFPLPPSPFPHFCKKSNIYYSWLIAEISDLEISLRQHRSNPRVVKKARSKFKSKKRSYRNNCTPRRIGSISRG